MDWACVDTNNSKIIIIVTSNTQKIRYSWFFLFVYSLVFTARNGGLVVRNANKILSAFLFMKK